MTLWAKPLAQFDRSDWNRLADDYATRTLRLADCAEQPGCGCGCQYDPDWWDLVARFESGERGAA